MSRLFGYDARLVLTDSQGRHLAIDAVDLSSDTDHAVITLENVLRAMRDAEASGKWGATPGFRQPWTVL